jgi:hypothetical protein
MLLIPANMEEIMGPLPTWEKRVWRERQGQIHTIYRAWGFAGFAKDGLEYATNMVGTSERLVLPKPTPSTGHRDHRLRRAGAADMTPGIPAA